MASETEESNFIHGMMLAEPPGVFFFAGTGTFAFGKEVFGSGGSDIFEGVLFRFDLPVDGFDEVRFFVVFSVNFIFCTKTFSWVETWNNLLFQGFVDEVNKLGIQLRHNVALAAVDGGLVFNRYSAFYVHKGST